jgi:hypothetical protein
VAGEDSASEVFRIARDDPKLGPLACALSVTGNRRLNSIAAYNSSRCSKTAPIAAASASLTANIASRWARTVWAATSARSAFFMPARRVTLTLQLNTNARAADHTD